MSNNDELKQQLEDCLLREVSTKNQYLENLQQLDRRAALFSQRIINERDAAVDELERYKNLVRTGILGGKKRKTKRKKRRKRRRRTKRRKKRRKKYKSKKHK